MNQMESMLHMSLTDRAQGTEGLQPGAVQAQFHQAGQLLMQVSSSPPLASIGHHSDDCHRHSRCERRWAEGAGSRSTG